MTAQRARMVRASVSCAAERYAHDRVVGCECGHGACYAMQAPCLESDTDRPLAPSCPPLQLGTRGVLPLASARPSLQGEGARAAGGPMSL